MVLNLLHLPVVDSTNTYLRSLVNAPEWTCVTADSQTAGRGRQQRVWYSAPGEGLYLSVLLRPTDRLADTPLLSLVAGIAVAETLIGLGLDTIDIKWPNDILVDGKKISGILVETSGLTGAGSTGLQSPRVIVGIGVNLNQRTFPADLEGRATSLLGELGSETRSDAVRDRLLERLSEWYRHWREGAVEMILNRWLDLSTYGFDREVAVSLDTGLVRGVTAGLTPGGALRLRTADGTICTIVAGDVTSLRPITPEK